MSNGNKLENSMTSVTAPVRKPVMRGVIECYFQSVASDLAQEPVGLGPGEVGTGSLVGSEIVETDGYVGELLRVLREMGLFVDFDTPISLPSVRVVESEGEP